LEAYKRALEIAARLSADDPRNAIFRSDLARAEAAFGFALMRAGQRDEGREMLGRSLRTFGVLKESKALSAEDRHRAEAVEQGLAGQRSK
jgi:hypothetical protein